MAYEDQFPKLDLGRTAIPVYTVSANGNIVSGNPASAFAITPNDTTDFTGGPIRGFQVGTSGNIAVIFTNDTTAVTLTVIASTPYPYAVKRVLATGTTATNIVGFR